MIGKVSKTALVNLLIDLTDEEVRRMSLLKANFHYNNKASRIFVISDSVGETANRLIQAALRAVPQSCASRNQEFSFY